MKNWLNIDNWFNKRDIKIENINIDVHEDIAFISFNYETLTTLDSKFCETEIKKIDATPINKIIIDLGGITYLDSMGVGILFHIYNYFKGKTIKIINIEEPVDNLFDILGIKSIFDMMEKTDVTKN